MKINLKYLVAVFFIVLIFDETWAQETVLKDSRDGQEYKILYLGKQVWMGDNLNFKTENSSAYEGKKRNSNIYGQLYSYDDALSACPAGWHLPSDKEWQELINFYGGDLQAGLALRIDGTSSFNAVYGGFMDKDGKYFDLGDDVSYWTSTSCDENDAWRCYIDRGFNTVVQDYFSKKGGLSVRCILDVVKTEEDPDKL